MNEKNTVILQIDDRSWTLTREVERDRYALPGTGRAASAESEALHVALGWAMVSDGWPLAVDGKPAAVLFFGEVRVSEDCAVSLSLRWREREEPAKSRQHVTVDDLRAFSSTPFCDITTAAYERMMRGAEEHIAAALRGSLATVGASGSYAAALVHDRAHREWLEANGLPIGWPASAPPPDPVAERRAREAPLVALVAAVPGGEPWNATAAAVDAMADAARPIGAFAPTRAAPLPKEPFPWDAPAEGYGDDAAIDFEAGTVKR